jgi:hypothetical protein
MSNEIATSGTITVDTRYTQDVIPVLDTSKFEHMQRIAQVMARMSTLPESLRGTRDDNKFEPFPDMEIVANCFRVANQAVRWGMDPFAVADCASIIRGRLMWEGKLVAAVIAAKLGVRLSYVFDDAPHDQLGVTVSGTLPGEMSARDVFGRVCDWRTTRQGSPWQSPANWKRQLRYRGAREWARAYVPELMLGIYADDELDEMSARDVPTGRRSQRFIEELPDIDQTPQQPVEAEASQDIGDAEYEDPPLADEAGFIEHLKDQVRDAGGDVGLIAEVQDANADVVQRMSVDYRKQAAQLYLDAIEGRQI